MRIKHFKATMYSTLLVIGIGMVIYPIDLSKKEETPANAKNSISETENSGFFLPEVPPIPAPATPTPTPILTPTPTPTLTPKENTLMEKVPSEIEQLINDYFAAVLEDSFDNYRKLIYNTESINEELTRKRVEYIVNYHNIRCYAKRGVGQIDYIVYVMNDVEIATIDTYAPSMEQFFIKYDKNKNPKIFLAGDMLTSDEEAYFNELNSLPDVSELVAEVTEQLNAAMEEDAELKNFIKKLSGN